MPSRCRLLSRGVALLLLCVVTHPASSAEADDAVANLTATLSKLCSLRKTGEPVRSALALVTFAGATEAQACLLQQLSTAAHASSPTAWALAATIFPAHSAALLERARQLLKDKAYTRHPVSFDVLGPFPIGKNEVDGDPLAAHGGALAHWLLNHNTSTSSRSSLVASELVPDGLVGWRREKTEPDGKLAVGRTMKPAWSALVQSLGQRAVLEFQAWAVGVIAVVEDGSYDLDCKRVHKAMLHDAAALHRPPRILNGDIYGSSPYGGGGFSVGKLRAGVYLLSMRVRAVVQGEPSCNLSPSRASWSVGPLSQLPDIILPDPDSRDSPRLCGGVVAFPIKNGAASGWLRVVSVRAKAAGVDARIIDARADNVAIAPGQLRLLAVQLSLKPGGAKVSCPFGTTIEVHATVSDSEVGSGAGDTASMLSVRVGGMQCRRPSQSIVCTHIDYDGAVSAAAIVRPRSSELCDGKHGCPVILSMHGTSIPVRDSADAFKYKPAGVSDDTDFTFGAERFWLVAPTRHGAHNWEQGGRLSALAALDSLAASSRTHGTASLPAAVPIDARRVLFVGHSMGGHGAWAAAVHSASRTIGVAAVSGWLRKETYGDSNFLFSQSVNDVSTSYVEPSLVSVLLSSIGENDLEMHLPLLRSVPHLARAGEADSTVHAFWARRAVRILAAADSDSASSTPSLSRLSELRGKKHWWWDTERQNDGGALNDAEMRSFFKSVLGPPRTRPALPPLPHDFELMAYSPAAFDGRAGWRILQLHQPARMASARIVSRNASNGNDSGGEFELSTRNVRRLMAPSDAVRSGTLRIDGDYVTVAVEAEAAHAVHEGTSVELCRLSLSAHWQACDASTWADAERGPSTAGPIRQVAHAPFDIVAGSGGDGGGAEVRIEMERLAVYLANLYVLTTDASPPVLTDVDATSELKELLSDGAAARSAVGAEDVRNWILIGGPRDNMATRMLAIYWSRIGHAATWSSDGALQIGSCAIPTAGVGALILGPKPGGGLALVVDGDDSGLRDAIAAGEPTIPPMARSPFSNTLPDYIVTGPRFGARGYGGLLAAGFFDYSWAVAPAASFLALDCRPPA